VPVSTVVFRPFGEEGSKVVLCGKNTGDWNVNGLQEEEDHKSFPGFFFRLNGLAERFHFLDVLMPVPTDCNAVICCPQDLTTRIQDGVGSVILHRGINADGVILPVGSTGAIASADCPTIIARSSVGVAIIAHGGMKSILNGVVNAIVRKAEEYNFTRMKIFITCGIAGYNFQRSDVASGLPRECVIGNDGVDLKKLIVTKFREHNIHDVFVDTVDTYGDTDGRGNPLWHS
jgi:hypothetical protein